MNVLDKWLYSQIKPYITLQEEQYGFTEGRGADLMIANLLLIQEIARARNEKLIMIFIDLEKAFDSVNQGDILEMMSNRNIP